MFSSFGFCSGAETSKVDISKGETIATPMKKMDHHARTPQRALMAKHMQSTTEPWLPSWRRTSARTRAGRPPESSRGARLATRRATKAPTGERRGVRRGCARGVGCEAWRGRGCQTGARGLNFSFCPAKIRGGAGDPLVPLKTVLKLEAPQAKIFLKMGRKSIENPSCKNKKID